MNDFIEVAVAGPMRRTFAYRGSGPANEYQPGRRLLVPFGKSKKVGFYIGPTAPPPNIKVKAVTKLLDQDTFFPAELFELCHWIAEYYFANPADVLSSALPSLLKTSQSIRYRWAAKLPDFLPERISKRAKVGRNLSEQTLAELKRTKFFERLLQTKAIEETWPENDAVAKRRPTGYKVAAHEQWHEFFTNPKFQPELFDNVRTRAELQSSGWSNYQINKALKAGLIEAVYESDVLDFITAKENVATLTLTSEQQHVFDTINSSLGGGFKPFLLHGVTGSGKTLVYCSLCREVLASGKTALILTPEIALSSTTLAYFRGFFGDRVTIIHSAMTERERLESWNGIRSGRFKIVVGPRSALFAPLPDLGLIVVDEEHDSSYKQDNPAPRFHGRDAAIMRARINKIPIVLGSASPSVESYHNARTGRYHLLKLTGRPGGAVIPEVRVVDLRTGRLKGDFHFLSYDLKKEVESRLGKDEQSILYLNRRGHSPLLKCAECGTVPECPNCKVRLIYHRTGNKVACHYCGHVTFDCTTCTKCGSSDFIYLGVGTQKVEEMLPLLFAESRIVRMDSDNVSGRGSAYRMIRSFSDKQNDILLGTQMVTKGLDLPDVTLVGVLLADMELDLADFRASEKTFARLLQVAGRSGRAAKPGLTLLQTFYPDNEVILDAARQDYEKFFVREIESRRQLSYPPFSRIVNFTLSSENQNEIGTVTSTFYERLKERMRREKLEGQIVGPADCPLHYLRRRYRRHMFVKTNQIVKLTRMLTQWESTETNFKLPPSVRIAVDVDPQDMM